LVVILGLVVLSISSCRTSDSRTESAETYSVYSEVLTSFDINMITSSEKAELLVIDDETNTDVSGGNTIENVFRNTNEPFPEEYKSALTDYRIKNLEPEKLTGSFEINQNYVLLARSDFESHFNNNAIPGAGWKSYYGKYPNCSGFITFSKVGFDPEKRFAVVYVEHRYSMTGASANYILLKKEKGSWKKVGRAVAWGS
jgi:hypothetical protein